MLKHCFFLFACPASRMAGIRQMSRSLAVSSNRSQSILPQNDKRSRGRMAQSQRTTIKTDQTDPLEHFRDRPGREHAARLRCAIRARQAAVGTLPATIRPQPVNPRSIRSVRSTPSARWAMNPCPSDQGEPAKMLQCFLADVLQAVLTLDMQGPCGHVSSFFALQKRSVFFLEIDVQSVTAR